MRLFIGIKTGCEVYLSSLLQELKSIGKGNFTHLENLHLTLKFLGEVPPFRIADISGAMKHIKLEPLFLECRGARMFGKAGIVSAEVGGDLASLSSLASKLDDALEHIGFAKETRPFRPHITLAREFRAMPGRDISTVPHTGCRFYVDEIMLFESARADGRLVYVPVYRQSLK